MASDAKIHPTDEPNEPVPGPTDDDTAGHSMPFAIGVGRLSKAPDQGHLRKADDVDLKPLTKQWPSLREGKPG